MKICIILINIKLAYASLVNELEDEYYEFLKDLKLDNETLNFCELVYKYKYNIKNILYTFNQLIIKKIMS